MRKNPGSPAAASVPDSGGAHRLPSSSQLEENDRAVTWDSVNDNEHKPVSRRRSSMACDMCRRKKIKCELKGRSKVCVQCIQHKMRCVFSTRKSKRESLKRAQHIRYLETRLKQVESLLKAAGVLPQNYVDEEMVLEDDEQLAEDDDDDEHDDEGYWEDPEALKAPEEDMGSRARSGSRVSSASPEGHACRHSQHAFLLRTNNRGEPRYFGRASCLSILSEEGIRWIRAKTGDNSFPNSLFSSFSNDDASSYWRPDVYHDLFASRVFKPLPQRAEVFSLLKDYFRTVNFLFPVYHEGTFMRLVEWQYTQQTCNDAARWASINVMLALAYRYRLSNSLRPERDNERAWMYFKNAMSVLTELTLRRTDLLSIQALLGMTLFLRGNSGVQLALPIVTAAIRSCHQLGLHRRVTRTDLSPVEQEQRKRVFWIAYILDQSICIRSGNAPAQDVDDFDVDLPEDDHDDGYTSSADNNCNIAFFRQLCRLTVIKSRIYGKLYSAKSLTKSSLEVHATVKELNAELEEWKRDNPVDYQLPQGAADADNLMSISHIGLQLAYYNSVIMINRIPLLHDFFSTPHLTNDPCKQNTHPRPLSAQSSYSTNICVQAARDSLKLVTTMPWGDIAWIWSLLYYLFLAVIIIFINILRNTKHPKSREDLRSLNVAVTFFATLIPGDGVYNNARFMANMCSVLERIAKIVIEKEEKDLKARKANRTLLNGKRSSIQASLSDQQDAADHAPGQNVQETTQIASPLESGSGIQVPNIDGLSAINSPDYAAPESAPDFSQGNVSVNGPTLDLAQGAVSYVEQSAAAAINYPSTATPDAYPFSNNMFVASDLWQIPLTADWELPNQFPGSVFAQGFSEGYGPAAFATPVPVTSEQTENGDGTRYINNGSMWNNESWNYGYDFYQ